MKTSLARHPPPRRNPATFATRVGVLAGDTATEAQSQQLAQELGLSHVTPENAGEFGLLLVLTPEHLELRDNSAGSGIGRASARPEGRRARDGAHHNRDPRTGPVYVDFTKLDLRPNSPNLSRRQPLARAVGKKTRTVVDATAGLAQDALLLALMGFRVTAFERSPVVAALARDGLLRLPAQATLAPGHQLQLITGDARALLPALSPRPDAIYLDPMFPPKRKKSAAVKKEMRLLRELVGDDTDAFELYEISRHVALDRVIVKRPDDAPPLAPDPSFSFPGKLVRYDVYLVRNPEPLKK
jgi:16S rRNA (guanine1516-N2)-methyltransferase